MGAGWRANLAVTDTQPPLVIGHLGNTIEALRAVHATGADGLEFDVRRSADGVLVLHHDPVIEGVGLVSHAASASLPPWIPRLEVALDVCDGMTVNVEVKNLSTDPEPDATEGTAKAVAGVIIERSLHEHVIVSSFSLAAIDAVRMVDPTIPTAFLTLPTWDQERALQDATEHGHRALHPHRAAATVELIAAAEAVGLQINPWAVDEPDQILTIAAFGVNAIITDAPGVAVATLAAARRSG